MFKQWLENVEKVIYVDDAGHLASPNQLYLIDFVKQLRELGVTGIRSDGAKLIGGTPHYDLLVTDPIQTQKNINLAISRGAIRVGTMQLMRIMRKSGTWTKRPPKSEVGKSKQARWNKIAQISGQIT
jgi:hypothetical protein